MTYVAHSVVEQDMELIDLCWFVSDFLGFSNVFVQGLLGFLRAIIPR